MSADSGLGDAPQDGRGDGQRFGAASLGLGSEKEAVGSGDGEGIGHVVRENVVPALQNGVGLCHGGHRQGAPGAGPPLEQLMGAGGVHQSNDVLQNRLGEVDLGGLLPQGGQFRGGEDALDGIQRGFGWR